MQPRGRGVGLFGGKPGPSLSDPPRLLALREIVLLICSLGGSKNGGALLKQLCVGGGGRENLNPGVRSCARASPNQLPCASSPSPVPSLILAPGPPTGAQFFWHNSSWPRKPELKSMAFKNWSPLKLDKGEAGSFLPAARVD